MAEEFKEKPAENPAPTENSAEKLSESPVENPTENSEEKVLSLKEYSDLEKEEIVGDFNRHVTIENLKLDRLPTRKEMAENYVKNKGPEKFAQKHILKGRGKKEESLDDGKIKT